MDLQTPLAEVSAYLADRGPGGVAGLRLAHLPMLADLANGADYQAWREALQGSRPQES